MGGMPITSETRLGLVTCNKIMMDPLIKSTRLILTKHDDNSKLPVRSCPRCCCAVTERRELSDLPARCCLGIYLDICSVREAALEYSEQKAPAVR